MSAVENIENKIITQHSSLNIILDDLRSKNRTVVFTNGCFDILHKGHVDYLNKAAKLGDILILGLNTDDSIRQIKDNGRPIQDQESRSYVLAGLSCIDFIVFFNEETPLDLIRLIEPDVLVKGSDYKAEDIIGYEIVKNRNGKIATLDFIEGYSTTSIIKKIVDNAIN